MLKRLEKYLGNGTIYPSGLPSRNVTYQKEAIKHWKGQICELEHIKKTIISILSTASILPWIRYSEALPGIDFLYSLVLIFVLIWYSPTPSWSLNQTWFERRMFYVALTQSSEPSMFISAITEAMTIFVPLFSHWIIVYEILSVTFK